MYVGFTVQVFFKSIESGEYEEVVVTRRLNQLLASSDYVVCPGLKDYPSESVRFTNKHVRLWRHPFARI